MSFTGKPELANLPEISNDGFWPDISAYEFAAKMRVPSEYATDVISYGLSLSIIRVNAALADAKSAIETAAYANFAAYLAEHGAIINQTNVLLLQYEHAVYCRAKAFLLQQFNTLNRRADAENAAKESAETEQYWLDEAQASIKALLDFVIPTAVHYSADGFHAALL